MFLLYSFFYNEEFTSWFTKQNFWDLIIKLFSGQLLKKFLRRCNVHILKYSVFKNLQTLLVIKLEKKSLKVQSVDLVICVCLCFSVHLSLCMSMCLSLLYVYASVNVCACLYVCACEWMCLCVFLCLPTEFIWI